MAGKPKDLPAPLPSARPTATDGREIDPGRGELSGEGALQRVREHELPRGVHPLSREEPTRFPTSATPTYYGQPLLKPTVWEPYIPLYFYVGGAAGALSTLGAAAMLFGGGGLEHIRRRARWLGLAGDALSGALLIADLGRPERFLNMMRVFRPTSPMNLGTWVLSGSGAANTASALFGDSLLGKAGEVASGVLGVPLAGYTAVLLSNTAVPTWQLANKTLPFLFVSSAAASAAALLQLGPLNRREYRIVSRFGTIAKAASLVASDAVERSIARSPEAHQALTSGKAGNLWTASRLLTAASLAVSVFGGRKRWAQTTSGLLGTAGALAMRFAVVESGKAAAVNPKATFDSQRRGLGASEVHGAIKDPQTGELIGMKLPVIA